MVATSSFLGLVFISVFVRVCVGVGGWFFFSCLYVF